MHVIGTTGHVDHGKSAFLRCLTGMEPDRLPAEKKTGMTIDLNFVWFDAKNGERIGIVDVPGHKKFVKNMISGVMNVEAFLFIVAADDGWMPQSEEHLEVLAAMGIRDGMILVTKSDLVDAERLKEVEAEAKNRVSQRLGHPFDAYPFSAVNPANIDTIRTAIENLVAALPAVSGDAGRLWVDRVFTPRGKGVVVTGTLREGSLSVGDEVVLYPQNIPAVVRGLQSYKQALEKAEPVSRVAVQLGKVEAGTLFRGSLIQKGKRPVLSQHFDAHIRFFTPMKMKNLELPVHMGTARTSSLVIPLEVGPLGAWVRIKPREPMAVRSGDRFLLRTPGEEKNCGGGVVVDPRAEHRHHEQAAHALKAWDDSALGYIRFQSTLHAALAIDTLWEESVFGKVELRSALDKGGFVEVDSGVFAQETQWDCLVNQFLQDMEALHKKGKDSILASEVSLELNDADRSLLVEYLLRSGKVQRVAQGLRLAAHRRQLDPWEAKIWTLLEQLFDQEGRPVRAEDFGDDAKKMRLFLQRLVKEGKLVNLAEDHFFGTRQYETLKAKVTGYLGSHPTATTSVLRTLLNTSRKYAVLFLERMDADRVTYLKDGVRKLLK
ncbi:MAG: selenocysteine-specific translation elongation factor [Bdellovibrionales bacterium]|nr:selenocysteine-specific translation elongation factor [Bdellovibrionales bacterium]